jgi:3-methyl-2-oxobutanoate hydroxymethyltransferase
LPFKSYETIQSAVANSKRLVVAGAEFVKAEGGKEILPQVKAIVSSGIPFCGHLGMLPQHVLEEGGYRIKGKKESEHQKLIDDAKLLADAGAFAIVLELVTPPVAKEISETISIPTIGIGSGEDCHGQILVTPDLVGLFPWFTPRFVKPKVNCAAEIKSAVAAWKNSVKAK